MHDVIDKKDLDPSISKAYTGFIAWNGDEIFKNLRTTTEVHSDTTS